MIEIRPIKDLRDTTEISRLCEESKEPIYIRKLAVDNYIVFYLVEEEKEQVSRRKNN